MKKPFSADWRAITCNEDEEQFAVDGDMTLATASHVRREVVNGCKLDDRQGLGHGCILLVCVGLANVEQLSPKGDSLELVVVVDEGDDVFMAGRVFAYYTLSFGLRRELLLVLVTGDGAPVGAEGLFHGLLHAV